MASLTTVDIAAKLKNKLHIIYLLGTGQPCCRACLFLFFFVFFFLPGNLPSHVQVLSVAWWDSSLTQRVNKTLYGSQASAADLLYHFILYTCSAWETALTFQTVSPCLLCLCSTCSLHFSCHLSWIYHEMITQTPFICLLWVLPSFYNNLAIQFLPCSCKVLFI